MNGAYIEHAAAMTPLGANLALTSGAMFCGFTGERVPLLFDNPIGFTEAFVHPDFGALVGGVAPLPLHGPGAIAPGFERLYFLARRAAHSCLNQSSPRPPLLLAVSQANQVPLDQAQFAQALASAEKTKATLVASYAEALERAYHQSVGGTAVAVGGADTFLEAERLAFLSQRGDLHYPGLATGFVPGEGAACLLLTPRRGAHAWARLYGVALEDRASSPLALATAAAGALAQAGFDASRVGHVSYDGALDRNDQREVVMALQRLLRAGAAFQRPHVLDTLLGYAGVASAAVAAAHWSYMANRGELWRSVALHLSLGPGARRSAFVIGALEPEL